MKLKEHPTVKAYLDGKKSQKSTETLPLKSSELKAIAQKCGADDVGLVDVHRETIKGRVQFYQMIMEIRAALGEMF